MRQYVPNPGVWKYSGWPGTCACINEFSGEDRCTRWLRTYTYTNEPLGEDRSAGERSGKFQNGYSYYIRRQCSWFWFLILFEVRWLWIPIRCNRDIVWILVCASQRVTFHDPATRRSRVVRPAACQMLLPLRNSVGQHRNDFRAFETDTIWEATWRQGVQQPS